MKHFFLVLTLLVNILIAGAQTAVGLKVGLQNSKFIVVGLENDIEPFLGVNIGGVINFRYEKIASFQMELNYSQKGISSKLYLSETSLDPESGADIKIAFDYMELPLLLRLSFGENNMKYYGLIGPYIGYPVRINITLDDYKMTINPITEGDILYMDLGFNIGGGISYDVGPGRIFGELRYSRGLSKTIIDGDWDSRSFQCNVGYLFTF